MSGTFIKLLATATAYCEIIVVGWWNTRTAIYPTQVHTTNYTVGSRLVGYCDIRRVIESEMGKLLH